LGGSSPSSLESNVAKLTLSDVSNILTAAATLNNNNATLEAALENTLSRDGTAPNEMNADLDLNGNRIYNLADAVEGGDAVTFRQIEGVTAGLADLEDAVADAQTAATVASTQSGIATTQAGVSTTQAGIATTAAATAVAATVNKVDLDGQNLTTASGWRTKLGLGGAAVLNVGTGAGTVAAGNDARMTDTRTPSALSVLNSMVANAAGILATKLAYVFVAFSRTIDSKLRERVTPQDFGATGNGSTDDTVAFQSAVTYCIANKRTLWLYGDYKITSTIVLTAGTIAGAAGYSFCMRGADDEATLLHDFNDHLFLCSTGSPAFFKARDFKIVSRTTKSSPKVAFYFNGGITRSDFTNIRYGTDGNSANKPWGFFTTPPATTCDTITFTNIFVEDCMGVCYDIAQGSTIYFNGGRVIGSARNAGSVGIRLLGNNGGVWLSDIDLINLDRGMHITQLGGTSNREIFIKQAAFDGCFYGLDIDDTSYINIVGLWASAAVEANIRIGTGSPTLNISGGTIFNSGVNPGGSGDGIQINSAVNFVMTGVSVRFNTGIGIRCLTAGNPVYAVMTGCTVVANGQGMNGQGTWALSGNFFGYNTTDFTPNAGTYKIRGCFGSGLGDAG
jgi:hypothetical protein